MEDKNVDVVLDQSEEVEEVENTEEVKKIEENRDHPCVCRNNINVNLP